MSQRPRQHGSRSERFPARLGRASKFVISLLLLYHLFAVFIAPFTFATSTGSTASPAAIFAMEKMRPYVDYMYLNHGYFFFAPEPGPSHLMRFESGDLDEPLVFPDRDRQWPRLLYHRHFMLSEWLFNAAPPLEQEALIRRQQPEDARLRSYDRLREAYIHHVEAEFGVENVTLTRVEHSIPSPFEYRRRRMRLTDTPLYRDLVPSAEAPPQGIPESATELPRPRTPEGRNR